MTHARHTDQAITGELSRYIVEARQGKLPPDVVEKAKHHVLDTLAAIVSGSQLPPGRIALRYVRSRAAGAKAHAEATVVGSGLVARAEDAAFANAMSAHADETDDSHWSGRLHPGAAVLPTALALAELGGCDGMALLRAVVLGYDIGPRFNLAVGTANIERLSRSKPTVGGVWAAGAAAAALMPLDGSQVGWLATYLAQQTCGVMSWARDTGHVEKAFAFAALPARVGVSTALMVRAGFTATDDPFHGEATVFDTFGSPTDPGALVRDLGLRYEVLAADMKRWPVGFPIVPVVDSLTALILDHRLRAGDIERVRVRVAPPHLAVVSDASIPEINLPHIVAVTLVDGGLTFESSHDAARWHDPAVVALRKKIDVVADSSVADATRPRQAIIEVQTTDGRSLRHHSVSPRGTATNPMTRAEVEEKAMELMAPILGTGRATGLIRQVWRLESLIRVSDLRPLLQA